MADSWEQAAADYKNSAHAATAPAPAGSNDDWKVWQAGIGDAPAAAPDKPLNDQLSDRIADPSMTPDTGWRGQIERFGQGAAEAITNPILHPIDTARGLLTQGTPQGDVEMLKNAAQNPANSLGQAAGGAILGHIGGGIEEANGALHSVPDPNVSAMKGLRVKSGAKNANRVLGNVDTARPYLQGTKSLEDLQARLPGAKQEVYGPYEQAIEGMRDRPLGNSTFGKLYDRDKEITAQLGAIKTDPIAMQQAAQKGLNQADLITEQKAIRKQLFPAIEDRGVDASGINKTYGALKGIEKQVKNSNTLLVPEEARGFGRVQNFDLRHPLASMSEVFPAVKDIANGRYWSANPVDEAIGDTFKHAGPKPDLGTFKPLPASPLPPLKFNTEPKLAEPTVVDRSPVKFSGRRYQ